VLLLAEVIVVVINAGLAVSAVTTDGQLDVVGTPDVTQSASSASVDTNVKEGAGTAANEPATTAVVSSSDASNGHTDISRSFNTEHLNAKSTCVLHALSSASQSGMLPESSKSGAVFWKSLWREQLCRCPSCLVNFVD